MPVAAKRLTSRRIEEKVNHLLIEFQGRYGMIEQPPVPIEEILEKLLGLTVDFDDLAKFGYPDADAFIVASTKQVFVHERRDPVEHPEMEGRYRFDLAHEAGHWVLHRAAAGLEPPTEPRPWLVGSGGELEWQANKFAAFLLMPKYLVLREWNAGHGSTEPITITAEMEAVGTANLGTRGAFVNAFKAVEAGPLALRFRVSVDAMRIRLEELGLLPR